MAKRRRSDAEKECRGCVIANDTAPYFRPHYAKMQTGRGTGPVRGITQRIKQFVLAVMPKCQTLVALRVPLPMTAKFVLHAFL